MSDHFIRLSQGQLNLLETCPPHFQRIYLEQLNSPIDSQQQDKQTWGSQFHLLMQQREIGLPIESLLKEDQQLQHSIESLIEATPDIWQCDREIWREAEHCRTLNFENYLLTVIYDLLVIDENKAKIFDWKTYLQPTNKAKLIKNWQTRLYLYALAETSDYLPEEISLTYWFVKLPTQPQSITFKYDRKQHEKNHQDLENLLARLDRWLENYSNLGIPFPHLSNCQEICPFYQSLLNSESVVDEINNKNFTDWSALINEIDEIAI